MKALGTNHDKLSEIVQITNNYTKEIKMIHFVIQMEDT